MMKINQWIYQKLDQEKAARLASRYQIPVLIANLLVQRGLLEDEEIRAFLKPDVQKLHSPFALLDMDLAVKRIITAIKSGEKITIYGDYDVDGITSVTILTKYLKQKGARVDYYIPDRITEGYGINIGALQKIITSGTKLLITVDSGITACDEVAFAMQNGMDVIITDHHECQSKLPQACAIVDPKREGSGGYREYCGAGVAFMLVLALEGEENLPKMMEEYAEFVALGTVADVVPLLSDNRILVCEGLKRLQQTKNLGLRHLLKEGQLGDKEITASKIAYALAPRINAAGRLGKANRAVELFLSDDAKNCARLSRELCNENDLRKSTEGEITQEAIEYIETRLDLDLERILVISGEGWHHGVLGIVTSKITEKYRRPSILISFDEYGIGKGSGRSIKGFNLFAALSHCAPYLIRYGGHEMAAGLSVDKEQLPLFQKALGEYASGFLTQADFLPKIYLDCAAQAANLTLSTYRKLKSFEPYGAANPEPIFSAEQMQIVSMRRVGMERHLKLGLKAGDVRLEAIGFGMGEYADFLHEGDKISAAFSLSANDYFDPPRPQLILKDIKL